MPWRSRSWPNHFAPCGVSLNSPLFSLASSTQSYIWTNDQQKLSLSLSLSLSHTHTHTRYNIYAYISMPCGSVRQFGCGDPWGGDRYPIYLRRLYWQNKATPTSPRRSQNGASRETLKFGTIATWCKKKGIPVQYSPLIVYYSPAQHSWVVDHQSTCSWKISSTISSIKQIFLIGAGHCLGAKKMKKR